MRSPLSDVIDIPGFSGSSLHTGSSWHGEQVNKIYLHNQNIGTDMRITKSELWIRFPARSVKAGLSVSGWMNCVATLSKKFPNFPHAF